jgi:hypothetical protein
MSNPTAYQPTGDPRRLAEILPPISGSTPTPSQKHSSTTGPGRALERSASTGTELGASGAGETIIGRWVRQQLGPFNLPEAVMRTLTSSLSSHLEMMPMSVIATDGQFDGLKVRFRMKPGMPKSAAQRDLATLDGLLRPASKADAVKHVAVLKARTKSAGQDQGEARFNAEVMVGDLAGYPIDVIEYACNYWVEGGRDSRWFPSWPELREICERRMQPRRALRKALQWVVDGEPLNAL